MSSPIKSLLPTPLSMGMISDLNCLNEVQLPLFKFMIDCSLSLIANFNVADNSLLKNLLHRQKTAFYLIQPAINSVKVIHSIHTKVLKLMKTSQPDQIYTNLENCQKYLSTVLAENTLLSTPRISYLIDKLAAVVHKSLQSNPKTMQTTLGTVQWSIYNLKKTNLRPSESNQSQSQSQLSASSLKTVNKIYVKVSFGEGFSPSQVEKLIQTSFQSSPDSVIEASLHSTGYQTNPSHNNHSKTIILSLIDFKLFIEEIEKVKNLNF